MSLEDVWEFDKGLLVIGKKFLRQFCLLHEKEKDCPFRLVLKIINYLIPANIKISYKIVGFEAPRLIIDAIETPETQSINQVLYITYLNKNVNTWGVES